MDGLYHEYWMKFGCDSGCNGGLLGIERELEVAMAIVIAMFQSCKRCSELAVLEMHLEL
ncbi:hypothetical protein J4442_00280 [Candidatus Woesearchaeota archaeon]|nr:hypothetical protein [Candidatus Woesearchaeota archaeon]